MKLNALPLIFLLALSCLQAAPPPTLHTFHHENVLGTSLEITVNTESLEGARWAEKTALSEIDRLASIFSTYQPNTEFLRWQTSIGVPITLSPELFQVLADCDSWREKSHGAFNPAAECLTQLWKFAAGQNRLPNSRELESAVQRANAPAWSLDFTNRAAIHLSKTPLSLNAIAKGFIVHRACSAILNPARGVRGAFVMIGGDLQVLGDLEKEIQIAHPIQSAENGPGLSQLKLKNTALATSGNYRRGVTIDGRRYSHILDPKTGQPADHISSASVLAPTTDTADALATIFSVLPPRESLRLAESLPGVQCLIASADGPVYRSPGWPDRNVASALFAQTKDADASVQKDSKAKPTPAATAAAEPLELSIQFEINRPDGARYLRPYLAAWIEDKDAFPVRTIALWLLQGPKGERYIPDLRRWHRNDQIRKLADGTDLVATVSSATRQPGKYSLIWDGADDAKKPVKPGVYTFYLEIAREHGTYQLMKKEFTVGGPPFTANLGENIEIKSATLEYRKKSEAR